MACSLLERIYHQEQLALGLPNVHFFFDHCHSALLSSIFRLIITVCSYTEHDSKVGFWLRWLCRTFFVFTRVLLFSNGRLLQTKKLRNPPGRFALLTCSSCKRAIVLFCKHPQPCQKPTFESCSVLLIYSFLWSFSK